MLPENQGDTIQWRKMAAFSAVTTPLTEGITPDSEEISITSTTGTVDQYGSYVRYSRKLAQFGKQIIAEVKSLLNNLGTLKWQPEASLA
jgi:N4-gp56 family major capsid protein